MAKVDSSPSFKCTRSVVRLVTIGGVTKLTLKSRLHDAGVRLNEAAEILFADHRFTTATNRIVVETVEMPVASLGLHQGGTTSAIFERALSKGLALCPLELGPHLRLQFAEQPEGFRGESLSNNCAPPGSITVASTPLADDDEIPKGFYLRRIEGILWLRGYRSWPGHVWSPHDVLLFARDQSAT